MVRRAGASDSGGRGEQADTADLSDVTHIVTMFGELMNLTLDALHFVFEFNDFVEHHREGRCKRPGELTVAEYCSCLAFGIGSPFGDGVAEFAEEPAKAIDALISGGLELFADAMQLLELLLLDRTNRDGLDAFAAMCFKQRFGIDAV